MTNRKTRKAERKEKRRKQDKEHKESSWASGNLINPNYYTGFNYDIDYASELAERIVSRVGNRQDLLDHKLNMIEVLVYWPRGYKMTESAKKLKELLEDYWGGKS